MKRQLPKHWERVDGRMEGCLGPECPDSCCKRKNLGGNKHQTTLVSAEVNSDFMLALRKRGVDISEKHSKIFIDNCSSGGNCKLSDQRPFLCKTYPFVTVPGCDPIAYGCPNVFEITGHNENVKKVLEMAKSVDGFKKSEWLADLEERREALGAYLKWMR